ncbi:C40 family peptidase [Lactobacillus sp. ESL0731]|uniref:C40 family peptidase n=1 Tax=unclassified Lactobacillus TaxID=2620435 RepID=UPI0023F88174|nr:MULTISPECIES: C40 family peptidase [unclassified Lactobacillus]WEV50889.1 C40 family peptidase [Lactobacillus sp. ESL0700]WEV62020.1 C40 family peptidase [Lactobacillus sp. ESL0731]
MKRNFLKMGLAAALTLTGIATVAPQKAVNAATLKEPIKQVQINYLPGKSIKIWTNYEGGRLINFRAKNASKWNVADTAVDKKGKLWYKVGVDEWIEARYTVEVTANADAAATSKPQVQVPAKKPKKTKPAKATAPAASKPVESKPAANNTVTTVANTVVSGNVSQRAKAVVNLAESQVGKSYVWGGDGPDSFDCSGLVQYVYNQVGGVSLPRVTTDQVKVGTTVDMSQLQPGDLLFWGSTDAPYHVAIYVGDNQYVSAATPEQGVVLQTLSSYFYPCVAKRVL